MVDRTGQVHSQTKLAEDRASNLDRKGLHYAWAVSGRKRYATLDVWFLEKEKQFYSMTLKEEEKKKRRRISSQVSTEKINFESHGMTAEKQLRFRRRNTYAYLFAYLLLDQIHMCGTSRLKQRKKRKISIQFSESFLSHNTHSVIHFLSARKEGSRRWSKIPFFP